MNDKPFTPVISTQFQARRLDFELGGYKAFLIEPTVVRPDGSRPWVWYAPTFAGRLPREVHAWMFTRLLADGFYVAGIDVGESYGNPEGRAAFTGLYRFVTPRFGLNNRACLMPQSRGGLMLYNWAVEHPEWVRGVGGIYTVCDLRSYPGLVTAAPAYKLTAEELEKHLAEHNPIDRLAPLAKARVPIRHIHGDADTVVPLELNSAELARRYRQLGGSAEVLIVRGKGHEECPEFFEDPRMVEFFMRCSREE